MNVECDEGLVGPQGGQAGLASHVPNLSKRIFDKCKKALHYHTIF
jgi:hypothetical protein